MFVLQLSGTQSRFLSQLFFFKVCFYIKFGVVAPDYAAYLSVPILDRGQNAKRKGDRLLEHVQCTCVHLIIIKNILDMIGYYRLEIRVWMGEISNLYDILLWFKVVLNLIVYLFCTLIIYKDTIKSSFSISNYPVKDFSLLCKLQFNFNLLLR